MVPKSLNKLATGSLGHQSSKIANHGQSKHRYLKGNGQDKQAVQSLGSPNMAFTKQSLRAHVLRATSRSMSYILFHIGRMHFSANIESTQVVKPPLRRPTTDSVSACCMSHSSAWLSIPTQVKDKRTLPSNYHYSATRALLVILELCNGSTRLTARACPQMLVPFRAARAALAESALVNLTIPKRASRCSLTYMTEPNWEKVCCRA